MASHLPRCPRRHACMPVCVQCGKPVPATVSTFGSGHVVLARCTHCERIVDPYLEYGLAVLVVDLILAKPRVYRHILYNVSTHSFMPSRPYGPPSSAPVLCRSTFTLAALLPLCLWKATWRGSLYVCVHALSKTSNCGRRMHRTCRNTCSAQLLMGRYACASTRFFICSACTSRLSWGAPPFSGLGVPIPSLVCTGTCMRCIYPPSPCSMQVSAPCFFWHFVLYGHPRHLLSHIPPRPLR